MAEIYQHCIFVCSNYTTRTRTGLHFLYNETNIENVLDVVKRYQSKEGVAFYFVNTDHYSIESVQKKDKFFRNIQISEGAIKENVLAFNDAINNQISVNDVALLLLCRQQMRIDEIKTALFFIYCLYAKENDKFPFKEKLFFNDKDEIGFKSINQEFKNIDPESYLECTKPDVIMSKFFNCEGGVELMNNILGLFYRIKLKGFSGLKDKILSYFNKCKSIYHLDKRESRYAFTLSKKAINRLKIDID